MYIYVNKILLLVRDEKERRERERERRYIYRPRSVVHLSNFEIEEEGRMDDERGLPFAI